MEIIRRCDVCGYDFLRAAFAKHLRSKNIQRLKEKMK